VRRKNSGSNGLISIGNENLRISLVSKGGFAALKKQEQERIPRKGCHYQETAETFVLRRIMMLDKIIYKIGLVLSLAVATTGLALADDYCRKDFPAEDQYQCEQAYGVFYQNDYVKKCVVTEKSYPVQCDRPAGNPFEAEIAKTTIFIKKEDGYGKEKCIVKKDKEVVACINPQGKGGDGVYIGTQACSNKGCFKKEVPVSKPEKHKSDKSDNKLKKDSKSKKY
jgi:hypothetical protein